MKTYLTAAVVALFLTACAGTGTASKDNPTASGQQQASQAISEAETAAEKADSVGYLWRDTEDMLEEAKKAAAAENYEKAVELANEARRQSKLAYQQYLEQRGVAE